MKDFPFDPYDFFGYVATGLLVLVGLEHAIGVPEIVGKDLKPLELSVVVLASYIVGQITATPAKALLEDFLVAVLLKKPSVNLMRTKTSALPFSSQTTFARSLRMSETASLQGHGPRV